MEKLSNWGKFPVIDAEITSSNNINEISDYVRNCEKFIVRGSGKSYGDSSLGKKVFSSLKLNKILKTDYENEVIQCESGVLIADILKTIVPLGYFLPVVPGTKFITIGGAIASNIHGKNHHKDGAFSNFIDSFDILIENGTILTCSKFENTELFKQSIGGMGLTGIILRANLKIIKIKSSFIKETKIKALNIYEIFQLLDNYQNSSYSVAWIDCSYRGQKLGRGILKIGEYCIEKSELRVHKNPIIKIPTFFPSFLVNNLTIKFFNYIYFNFQLKKIQKQIIHYDDYFFPLDKINNWNNIYGKNGFLQYQFLVPTENGKQAIIEVLKKINEKKSNSLVAVLKTFGDRDFYASNLSFPQKGYTLALDFKNTLKNRNLISELDQIVLNYKGKIYLAKDAIIDKEKFKKMYPEKFEHSSKFESNQSKRLEI